MTVFAKNLRFLCLCMCACVLFTSCAANVTQTENKSETAAAASETKPDNESEDETMNTYTVKRYKSTDAINWDEVEKASVNNYKWVECKKFNTEARLVYVEEYGFVCKMTCYEANPFARYTEHDDPVCLDSCMEFFACYAGEGYLNIESNSIGTTCIQFGPSREDRASTYRRFKTPLRVTPEVDADKWSVTMEIPLDKLRVLYGEKVTNDLFASGYTFTGNFYKTAGAEYTNNEHYAMWNEVGTEKPDFHRPEYFGTFIME